MNISQRISASGRLLETGVVIGELNAASMRADMRGRASSGKPDIVAFYMPVIAKMVRPPLFHRR
jgi:hypothetical protein